MSLTQGVLGLIEDAARRESFSRVRTVWLEIGRLACVEPEALRFAFDVVTHGTCAQGARLVIDRVPGQAWCLKCDSSVVVDSEHADCPRCGSARLQVTGGDQMRLRELEVE